MKCTIMKKIYICPEIEDVLAGNEDICDLAPGFGNASQGTNLDNLGKEGSTFFDDEDFDFEEQ